MWLFITNTQFKAQDDKATMMQTEKALSRDGGGRGCWGHTSQRLYTPAQIHTHTHIPATYSRQTVSWLLVLFTPLMMSPSISQHESAGYSTPRVAGSETAPSRQEHIRTVQNTPEQTRHETPRLDLTKPVLTSPDQTSSVQTRPDQR